MAGESATECTVGDVAAPSRNALVGGPFGSDLVSRDYVPSGVPVIRGANMGHGRWVDGEFVYVTPEKADSLASNCAKPGDLVFTQRGTLGQVALVPKKGADRYLISQSQMKVTLDPTKADALFLYYVFISAEQQAYIVQNAITTGVPHTNLGILRNTPLTLPPLAEQKAIAAVLGALDDKIELNRRMNATLEAMARALFQSWFVDFDPVRRNLDRAANGKHKLPTLGKDPAATFQSLELDALFPAAFQDSAVGHIPLGWKVGVLDELTKFVIGGDWGATEPTDDETVSCYCIRGADIPSLQSGGVGKMPTRFLKPSSIEKRQLADGDLAIEISGGSPTQCTGRPVLASEALLQNLGQPLVASNFCRIVKLKSPALSKFVYLWLRRLYDAGELFQFETGTTGIKNFAFVIFSEKYPVVVPDLRVAEAFDRAVSPFFARIQANSQESRTLATLRDTLLPKLLSGELKTAAASANVTVSA